jgi:hypothetical protein
MIEDEITVVKLPGNTYCEGRGRIEKLYLTNRVGYKLGVGFIDTATDTDATGSAGFIDDEKASCLYVIVAVPVTSACLGVLDAESSVCFGVLDAESSVCLGVLDTEDVAVLVSILDAVIDAVLVTSACLGVLDATVCLGVLVEDSIVLIMGISFGDALTVAVIEY